MGEIGIDEDKFLYHHNWWQLTAIRNGYRRRTHEMQLLTRWQTWAILKGVVGLDAETPQDLMTLPCDPPEEKDIPTEEDIMKLVNECQEYNRNIEQTE